MACNKDCRADFAQNAKYRVSVQNQVLIADDYGGQVNTWTTVGTYWAWLKPLSTYEKVSNAQIQASATHKMIIRFQSALKDVKVTGSYRATFDNRIYNILGIKNLDNSLSNYGVSFQELLIEDNGAEKA